MPSFQVNLGLLLEIFSDARVVAPLVRAANLQSNSERASYLYFSSFLSPAHFILNMTGERASYLYVFKHTTEAGYYPEHGVGGIR